MMTSTGGMHTTYRSLNRPTPISFWGSNNASIVRELSPATLCKFNQAFFKYVIVTDKHITKAKLAEPFRSLLTVPTSRIRWTKRAAFGTFNHLASLLKEVA